MERGKEWTVGLAQGKPSINSLNEEYGSKWREESKGNAFENHHQNIHFEWCEKKIKSLQATSFFATDIQRTSPNFANGLGYSTLVGHMDDERVVIEASSGGENENMNHTQDDALKLIKALTSIVILKAYQMKNARFETYNKFKAISIQVIKRKLTLSVLSMAPNKKFVFDERRSATIPITFHERDDWLLVFELLADFEQLLNEQDKIERILRHENSCGGAADDETIQHVFKTTDDNMNGSQIVLDNIIDTNTSLGDDE
ncbi:hypothetical protein BDC45DRAFT_19207 [Circinella umbellata]|nr:hypothetical protein BDC45DRAFT_19207 [Circinella umbellata]